MRNPILQQLAPSMGVADLRMILRSCEKREKELWDLIPNLQDSIIIIKKELKARDDLF